MCSDLFGFQSGETKRYGTWPAFSSLEFWCRCGASHAGTGWFVANHRSRVHLSTVSRFAQNVAAFSLTMRSIAGVVARNVMFLGKLVRPERCSQLTNLNEVSSSPVGPAQGRACPLLSIFEFLDGDAKSINKPRG